MDNSTIRTFVRKQIMADRAAKQLVSESDWCEPSTAVNETASTQPTDMTSRCFGVGDVCGRVLLSRATSPTTQSSEEFSCRIPHA